MYHILVVDDEAKIREIIKKYALFEGYRVSEAANGMEAIDLCFSYSYARRREIMRFDRNCGCKTCADLL